LAPGGRIARLLTVLSDHFADGDAEPVRELKVALVVRGDAHDRARTIAHQYVVCYPDRDLLAVHGIGDVAAGKDARLLLFRAQAFDLGLVPRSVNVGLDLGPVFGRGDLL